MTEATHHLTDPELANMSPAEQLGQLLHMMNTFAPPAHLRRTTVTAQAKKVVDEINAVSAPSGWSAS